MHAVTAYWGLEV